MERTNPKLAHLFEPAPMSWALPGDAALWQAFREHFAGAPMPASSGELDVAVGEAFLRLCNRPIGSDQSFRVPRFVRPGGSGSLSEGAVSPQFWRDRVLPLLKSRWLKAQQDAAPWKGIQRRRRR